MALKAGDFLGRDSGKTIDLEMPDGRVIKIPMRRHEEIPSDPTKRPRTWYTTDWAVYAPMHCDRCDGYFDKDSGEMFNGAGLITVAFRRRWDEKTKTFAEIEPGEPWIWKIAACSCVFGAWRRRVQRIPFADSFTDIPALTSEQWSRMRMAGGRGSYADVADKLSEEAMRIDVRKAVDVVRDIRHEVRDRVRPALDLEPIA